jgi:hypothetical protein
MKLQKRRAKRIIADKQSSTIRPSLPLHNDAETKRQKQEEKLLNTVAEIILNIIMEEDK